MAMSSKAQNEKQKENFKSPKSAKRLYSNKPKKHCENKENDRFKILQKAASIAQSKKCDQDKDFYLLKIMHGTKEQPKTPNQNSLTQIELMEMFSKESEKIYRHKEEMYDELFKTKPKILKKEQRGLNTAKQLQSYKSPVRDVKEYKESFAYVETANYLNSKFEQLKEIEIPDLIPEEVETTKSKSKLIKFNDKVRKANMKLIKRKKSK